MKKALYWIPRILAIMFIVFVSLFALDIFGMGLGFWGTIVGLIIHLIPSFILIIALLISWKWEHIGGIIFILLGIAYIILVRGRIMSGLPIVIFSFLVGILFLISYFLKKKKVKRKRK